MQAAECATSQGQPVTLTGPFSHFGPVEIYVQIALGEIIREGPESCLHHLLKG